jgi:hypothetical protein
VPPVGPGAAVASPHNRQHPPVGPLRAKATQGFSKLMIMVIKSGQRRGDPCGPSHLGDLAGEEGEVPRGERGREEAGGTERAPPDADLLRRRLV